MNRHEEPAATLRSYDAVAADDARLIGDELVTGPWDRARLGAPIETAGGGVAARVGCDPRHVTVWVAA